MKANLPSKVIIKYSKITLLWLLVSIGAVVGSSYLLVLGNGGMIQYLMAGICGLWGAASTVFNFIDLLEWNKPQLTLSDKGIQFRDRETLHWKEIQDEKIIYQGTKRMPYLLLKTPEGDRLIGIRDMDRGPDELITLIRAYRKA